MKTLKTILSAFALAAILSTGALAQDATATVNATATLNSALTATVATNVAFGNVPDETIDAYLDANANDTGTEANVGAGATPGQVDLDGTNGAEISVSFGTATLANFDDNTDLITFTPTIFYGTTEVEDGDAIALDGNGEGSIDIGGSLTSSAADATGFFSTANSGGSALTVTFNYN